MQHQKLLLTDLMPEIFTTEILPRLNPESLMAMKLVSRRFFGLANNELWDAKTRFHFRRFLRAGEEFKTVYQQSYKTIQPEKRILFSLVKEGDIKRLTQILTIADLDLNDIQGRNLLYWAMFFGHQAILDFIYQMVKKISKASKSVPHPNKTYFNSKNEVPTLLHWAVFCNQSSATIEKLLTRGCDTQSAAWLGKPFEIATRCDHVDSIKPLLTYSKVNVADYLYTAASNGSIAVMKIFYDHLMLYKPDELSREHLEKCLDTAAQNGHQRMVKFLLDHGAEVNPKLEKRDRTPLFSATFTHHFEAASVLLKYGADVDACVDRGPTPLFMAVQINNSKLVNLLLAHGADVHKGRLPATEKFTPLTMAAEVGAPEIIQALLDKGANVNHTTGSGMTPLHYAVRYRKAEAVQVLLENGADINAKYLGQTPLDLAKKINHSKIIEILLPYHRYANFLARNKKSDHVHLSLLNNRRAPATQCASLPAAPKMHL